MVGQPLGGFYEALAIEGLSITPADKEKVGLVVRERVAPLHRPANHHTCARDIETRILRRLKN